MAGDPRRVPATLDASRAAVRYQLTLIEQREKQAQAQGRRTGKSVLAGQSAGVTRVTRQAGRPRRKMAPYLQNPPAHSDVEHAAGNDSQFGFCFVSSMAPNMSTQLNTCPPMTISADIISPRPQGPITSRCPKSSDVIVGSLVENPVQLAGSFLHGVAGLRSVERSSGNTPGAPVHVRISSHGFESSLLPRLADPVCLPSGRQQLPSLCSILPSLAPADALPLRHIRPNRP